MVSAALLWLGHTSSRLPVFKCLSDPFFVSMKVLFFSTSVSRARLSNTVLLTFILITTLTFSDPFFLFLYPVLLFFPLSSFGSYCTTGTKKPAVFSFWLNFLSKSLCMLLLDKWPLRFQRSFHLQVLLTTVSHLLMPSVSQRI